MSFGEYPTSAYPDPCEHGAANNCNETRVRPGVGGNRKGRATDNYNETCLMQGP